MTKIHRTKVKIKRAEPGVGDEPKTRHSAPTNATIRVWGGGND